MKSDNLVPSRKASPLLWISGLAMVWILGNLGLQAYTTNKLENLAQQGRVWEGIVKSYDIIEELNNPRRYLLWGPEFSAENYLRRYLP